MKAIAQSKDQAFTIKRKTIKLIDAFADHVCVADPHEIAAYIEDIVEATKDAVKRISNLTSSGTRLNISVLDEYVGLAWENVADLAQDFHGEMRFLYEELLDMFEQVCARATAIINNA